MKVKLSKVYKSCSDAQSLGLWRLRLAEGWSLRREFKPQESGILPIFFSFSRAAICTWDDRGSADAETLVFANA